jgi:hypothetical protein
MKKEDTKKNTKQFFLIDENREQIIEMLNKYKEQLKIDIILLGLNIIQLKTKNTLNEFEFVKSVNNMFNDLFEAQISDYKLKVTYKKNNQFIFLKIKRITF